MSDLRKLFEVIVNFSTNWGFEINFSKCELIAFGKSRFREYSMDFSGSHIAASRSFKYFGLTFNRSTSWSLHRSLMFLKLRRILPRAASISRRLTSNNLPFFLQLFDVLVFSAVSYSSILWGISQSQRIDASLARFLKKVPVSSYLDS